MKLYIENCKLKKDRNLPDELEEEFKQLNNFYFSHCGYSSNDDCNKFYYYRSRKEKETYLNSYSHFLSKLKEIIDEPIEDNIYNYISNYHIISKDDSRIYLLNNGYIKYFKDKFYEDLADDVIIINNKNAKLIYPQYLSNDDINYILENVRFAKGIYESEYPIYWGDRTRELSILDIEKMMKKANISKVIHILKCICTLKGSVFINLNLNLKITEINEHGIDNLLVLEICNSLYNPVKEAEKIIKDCINDYYNFVKKGILSEKISNNIINNIFYKRKNATTKEKETYINLCEKEASKNNKTVLYQLACGYYKGDEFFKCDSYKAKEYFEKLVNLGDIIPTLYLGKLYYYGRLDLNGNPNYKKALDYFRIASDYGIHEAACILGDMYLNGLGTINNRKIAYTLYIKSYVSLLKEFLNGNFVTIFPDVCARIANWFYENKSKCSLFSAFYYIKLAKLASNCRMDIESCLKNKEANENINKIYEKIKETYIKNDKIVKNKKINYFPLFYGNDIVNIDEYMHKSNEIIFCITPKYNYFIIDNDDYEYKLASSIIIKFNTLENNVEDEKSFITDYIEDSKIKNNCYEFITNGLKIKYKSKRVKIIFY